MTLQLVIFDIGLAPYLQPSLRLFQGYAQQRRLGDHHQAVGFKISNQGAVQFHGFLSVLGCWTKGSGTAGRQHRKRGSHGQGALIFYVKIANTFNGVAEKLDAAWMLLFIAKNIQQSAANADLPRPFDALFTHIAHGHQGLHQI
ncbi:MAG: hypothetical protein BWY83_02048 [bacterium ADurb.Bin478]|nr:MAG: hypothetical protein BWY83_02048 [bacterium ADurb.Bin478]